MQNDELVKYEQIQNVKSKATSNQYFFINLKKYIISANDIFLINSKIVKWLAICWQFGFDTNGDCLREHSVLSVLAVLSALWLRAMYAADTSLALGARAACSHTRRTKIFKKYE